MSKSIVKTESFDAIQNRIVEVEFSGGYLQAVQQGDDIWVLIRRVCEHLGIDRKDQQRKLNSKKWARLQSLQILRGATDPGGLQIGIMQTDDVDMLHMDSVPMWLATINANRVSKEAKPALIAYQKEAAKVLRDHFFINKTAIQKVNNQTAIQKIENNDEYFFGKIKYRKLDRFHPMELDDMNSIIKIGFEDGEIEALKFENDIYISVRKVCEHLGLNERVERHGIAFNSKIYAVNILAIDKDGKKYNEFMVHINSFQTWLSKIRVSRDRKKRDLLAAYQYDAVETLYSYFSLADVNKD